MRPPAKTAFRALGVAIREERKRQKFSQEELAFRAEVNRTYMGCVERGEKNITLESLMKIASVMKTKPSDFLERAGF